MAEETGQKQSKIQNLLELLQKTFLTVRDTINNQVKKHISLPDLQIGLEDEKYPPRGIIFPSRTAPSTTTNKLYNENGELKFADSRLVNMWHPGLGIADPLVGSTPKDGMYTTGSVGIGRPYGPSEGRKLQVYISEEENTEYNANTGGGLGALFIQNDSTISGEHCVQISSEQLGATVLRVQGKYVAIFVQDVSDGHGLNVRRNINEAGSNPLVEFKDDHTSNTQTTLLVQQDGTGDILNLFDGATEVFTVADGGEAVFVEGGVDVRDQNTLRRSSGRYYLEEFFSKRPQINATINGTWNTDSVRACNQLFELQGTGKVDTGVDWGPSRAGLLLITDNSADDQQIIAPHEDQGADSQYDSAWRGVLWGTENQVEWETAIMTTGNISSRGFWAGLKQSNTSTINVDADQAYFTYCSDGSTFGTLAAAANWNFVYSINGTHYITDLGLAVATTTIYRFRISIDSSRQVSVFINDTQYGLTQTGGTTGTVESDSRQKSVALKDGEDFIPYVGVQTLTTSSAYMYLFYEKISRILYE